MQYLTVKEVANRLSKSEETVKRRLRAGVYPNAFKRNDKEGWRIPEEDLNFKLPSSSINVQVSVEETEYIESSEEIIKLAYQIATLCTPSKEEVILLSNLDFKHSLEILLVMRQSANKIKNPLGFIKRAINEGWSPSTLPEKVNRKRQNLEERLGIDRNSQPIPFTFYNWLEDDKE